MPKLTKPYTTKVGDKLYSHDSWRSFDECSEIKISGETSQSRLLGTRKVNKKTMLESNSQYSATLWYTARGKADEIWIKANACNIGEAISASRDVTLLRTIAGPIGCKVVE